MASFDRKLNQFIKTIMLDANSECEKIRNEIDKRRSAYIDTAETELLNEMYSHIRAKVAEAKTNAGRLISQKALENKKALYNCRSEIEKKVLDKVRARISEYVQTPEYLSQLRIMAAYAARLLEGSDIVISLRADDMKYADELDSQTPAIYTQGDFVLGGLIAVSSSKNLRIDMTFDASLTEVSGKFGEISGLGA